MRPRSRLVIALDEVKKERALEIAQKVPEADAIKVNYPLVLRHGLDTVRELSKHKPVICDFKIADIDNTNRLIAEAAFDAGATALIVHTFVGRDSMQACKKVADKHGGMIIAVVEMSHPGAVEFIQPVTDDLIKAALEGGADGFIAPGTRPERITHIRRLVGDKLILTPGIGAQGGSAMAAVKAGADFVIVGRAIYQADDPGAEARKVIAEIGE